jgi:hypothetical protein
MFVQNGEFLRVTGWTVWGSNSGGGGEIFRTLTDRRHIPPSLLYHLWIASLYREESGRRVTLTTHPYPAPRLKKAQSYNSTPHVGLHGLN